MKNYEILKETKIIYEYLNDLLENANFEIDEESENTLKQSMRIVGNMYENTYQVMKSNSEEKEQLGVDCDCPHCNEQVLISDLISYGYVCDKCDENYYLGEGDLNYEWYFEDSNRKKLNEDYFIEIDYNSDKEEVLIGTECSSGAHYKCNCISDLKRAINNYADNYIVEEDIYKLKIWETEEDRDNGTPFIYKEDFYMSNDAILQAKKVMSRQNYAFIEVIKDSDNSAIFGTDGGEFNKYYDNKKYKNKIYKVDEEELVDYLKNKTDNENKITKYDLLYCESGSKYVAIDNSDGECYTENFDTEAQAVFWLNSDVVVEQIPFEIIPKNIIDMIIDKTTNKYKNNEL